MYVKPQVGEFYADLDEETGMYCVFHTERDNFAFSSWASREEAKGDADRLNA